MKKSLVLAFPLLFFSLFIYDITSNNVESFGPSKVNAKIAGGYKLYIEDVPYQVFVKTNRDDREYFCGGSIISEICILTAAHCLDGADRAEVITGQSKITPGVEYDSYTSTDLLMHKSYVWATRDYDVGIIRITDKISIDNVTTRIVQIANDTTDLIENNSVIRLTGYGNITRDDIDEDDDGISRNLIYTDVAAIDRDLCMRSFSRHVDITSRQFCVNYREIKGFCLGDYGGPAIWLSYDLLVGVGIFGNYCGSDDYPDVLANITEGSIRGFIRDNCDV